MLLRCADGLTRNCYPIIAGFVADYEEQALITGVKNGQHCVICQIPPGEREHLTPVDRYPLRTHQYTHGLIVHGRRDRKRKRNHSSVTHRRPMERYTIPDGRDTAMDVDDITSFMWDFQRVNMHEIMHVDLLHQCFKGVVHRAITEWVLPALKDTLGDSLATASLDRRFAAIPPFPMLKRFTAFSNISQWTGVEQKALLRQLVPVLAPLLSRPMIQFVRAVVDFTLHAQYFSHDTDTLLWMEAALQRIDLLKEIFRPFTAPTTGFNFPKLHALSHYPMMIRKFGSADGFDTAMFEAAHRYIVKDWYKLTNRHDTFEQQIFEHNQRAIKMLSMQDLLDFKVKQANPPDPKEVPAQITAPARPLNLDSLGWAPSTSDERHFISSYYTPSRISHPFLRQGAPYWRYAATVAGHLQLPCFLDALAAFVREERRRHLRIRTTNLSVNQKESDSTFINHFLVCIHPSLSCWKVDRDDGMNTNYRTKEFVRCRPWQFQGQGRWRRDCVWVQEYPQTSDQIRPLQGRLPGQLLVIISIIDPSPGVPNDIPCVYSGALIDVYTLRNQGRQNAQHGMIEAQRHPPNIDPTQRSLGYQRFYHLGLILRSAHLIAASDSQQNIFYINPYVDQDQYATVFDEDFLEKDAKIAQQVAANLAS